MYLCVKIFFDTSHCSLVSFAPPEGTPASITWSAVPTSGALFEHALNDRPHDPTHETDKTLKGMYGHHMGKNKACPGPQYLNALTLDGCMRGCCPDVHLAPQRQFPECETQNHDPDQMVTDSNP